MGCLSPVDNSRIRAILPNESSKIAMSVLTLPSKPIGQQIEAIKRGFPSDSLMVIARALGVSKQSLVAGLNLAQRTVTARENAGTRFSPEESERLLRVVRVRELAREVFTNDEAVAEWMGTPKEYLDGQTPLRALETGLGAARVENLVKAMVHGVPL